MPARTAQPNILLITSDQQHYSTLGAVNDRHKSTVHRYTDDGELFDLQDDPDEVHNLWHAPEAAELKSRLLLAFMRATLEYEQMAMPRIAGA